MKSPIVLAALALTIVLAGCAPTGGDAGPTAGPETPEPAPTSTPEPTEAPELVLGIDGIELVDGSGTVTSSATMADSDDVIALVTAALGAPTGFDSTEFGDSTDWGDVNVISRGGFASVNFLAAQSAGYDLVTGEGVSVGATVAEVDALEHYDDDSDFDGDGDPDIFGLEPRDEPGTDSLTHPGDVGTSYIAAFTRDGAVWRLGSPAGDWRDL